ncbi:hypothetical protein WSK_1823 [Novosphingobium sp. Rr 2-17]|uniref:nuclear transport factor 2 family protein n=1 Tax=Novosphingobium sp. Rr 2-17 TaxID=555793 RepID=UPI000269AB3A|nr:hypothetical protein [Novosphingobium sp. Rr 2-17]EIZ79590.1 hypothetical protein WSK_1823 [Novosphingobium sp. Rr 2-17]
MRTHSAIIGLVLPALITGGPVSAADAGGEANIRLVQQFLAEVRVAATGENTAANVRAVAEQYMDADYIQHAPGFPPGREGYIQVMSQAMRPPASGGQQSAGERRALPKDINFVADGPYVIWVSELPRSGGALPAKRYMFNMFRIENGKFKEHWDSE